MLQRFDGSAWRDVASYRTTREADAALDRAVGDGEEPGALRVVDPAPSTAARVLMIIATVVCVAFAIGIVWILVAGN